MTIGRYVYPLPRRHATKPEFASNIFYSGAYTYDPSAIRRLKDEVGGGLYTSGSGTLVRAMLTEGLVDELHLCVYPLTRGSGPRLSPEGAPTTFSLAVCESYENGVVYLNYRRKE